MVIPLPANESITALPDEVARCDEGGSKFESQRTAGFTLLGRPVVPFYLFFGGGFPY